MILYSQSGLPQAFYLATVSKPLGIVVFGITRQVTIYTTSLLLLKALIIPRVELWGTCFLFGATVGLNASVTTGQTTCLSHHLW